MGFENEEEQINLDFAVLLFIMEQSLKEENCTIDDIAFFIDNLNTDYFKKEMSIDDCRSLADFIVGTVLSNNGVSMSFDGYDFDQKCFRSMTVSYVANRIVYAPDEKEYRTSFYLTDDGYNLLLGTLEVESNMKLSIQDLIFRLHLERQNYDKALDDIKNIFNLIRIQIQINQEAMSRIRRNVLTYTADDYDIVVHGNMDTFKETERRFEGYRKTVQTRRKEMQETHPDRTSFTAEEREKLANLQEIDRYLARTLDAHQSILNTHFSLKAAYSEELDRLHEFSLIERFSLRSELYDKVLADPSILDRLGDFLYPLYNNNPSKMLNLNRLLERQNINLAAEEDTIEEFHLDEEAFLLEQERIRKEKEDRYRESLSCLLSFLFEKERIQLSDIAEALEKDSAALHRFIPNTDVFKEIFIELLRRQHYNLKQLQEEKRALLKGSDEGFSISRLLLDAIDSRPEWSRILEIDIRRLPYSTPVVFHSICDSYGNEKAIRCSNIQFTLKKESSV